MGDTLVGTTACYNKTVWYTVSQTSANGNVVAANLKATVNVQSSDLDTRTFDDLVTKEPVQKALEGLYLQGTVKTDSTPGGLATYSADYRKAT